LKYDVRVKMVHYAAEHGIKPAARAFGCQPKIVRKWLRRWREDNHSRRSLTDRSRAPNNCPHKTSPEQEREVLRERDKAPCLGARRLKDFCELAPSEGAIARILRQNGRTQRRKKKYEKKRDMRELKARLKAFEQVQIDTKYLDDIPYYVEQMARNKDLPRFEYTARDVKTGATFLGFGDELSESHACVFAAAVLLHLNRCGHPRKGTTVQTDNGSEYSGMERKIRTDRGFTHVVRDLFGATHRFIPPGQKNHQSDVESLHERIEAEFLDLERFATRQEFLLKASAWQLWWNSTRKNGYKASRSPDHILLEENPLRNPNVWLLPALDLDHLLKARAKRALDEEENPRGYYVPALPERRDRRPGDPGIFRCRGSGHRF
jgi:transposase-like protein